MVGYTGRALHFVFKIGDRKSTIEFYKNILGMKILRHEEFSEGCEATCNGPYANRWSKTMIGYGPEDDNFVLELTYNYPIKSYEMGNDFIGITINNGGQILENAKKHKWPILAGNKLEAPGGYTFFISDAQSAEENGADSVQKVILASSNLEKTVAYWNGLLKLNILQQDGKSATFGFSNSQTKVEFQKTDSPIEHAKAYGRIAFSIPHAEQPQLDNAVQTVKGAILTPLTSLDTPGKATVRVIILADPDGHEICFVDDEGFRQLSRPDPKGNELLDKYIAKDTS